MQNHSAINKYFKMHLVEAWPPPSFHQDANTNVVNKKISEAWYKTTWPRVLTTRTFLRNFEKQKFSFFCYERHCQGVVKLIAKTWSYVFCGINENSICILQNPVLLTNLERSFQGKNSLQVHSVLYVPGNRDKRDNVSDRMQLEQEKWVSQWDTEQKHCRPFLAFLDVSCSYESFSDSGQFLFHPKTLNSNTTKWTTLHRFHF